MYEFADEVFVEESSVRFYGFRIQTRMAAIRLSGNRLFVYSPVPLKGSLRDELERLPMAELATQDEADLRRGWQQKIARAENGEQRWGLFSSC